MEPSKRLSVVGMNFAFFFALLAFPSSATPVEREGCISNPSVPSCANYTMPPPLVQWGIDTNCNSNMGGCTVQRICRTYNSAPVQNSVFCKPFSILKDLCIDMPDMRGCSNYTSMCSNVSVVHECETPALPLPKTMWLSNTVEGLCNSMPDMAPCGQCKKQGMMLQCDLLQVYSDICMSMFMPGCEQWESLCTVVPGWPICTSSGKEKPMMRMYFHASILDYVLFKEWVPRNDWQYSLTVVAIILFGMLYEFLKVCRSNYEGFVGQRRQKATEFLGIDSSDSVNVHMNEHSDRVSLLWGHVREWSWKVELVRAIFAFLETAVGLLLMLIAMTFNIGLFLAVCGGAFLGSFVFGHFANTSQLRHGCH